MTEHGAERKYDWEEYGVVWHARRPVTVEETVDWLRFFRLIGVQTEAEAQKNARGTRKSGPKALAGQGPNLLSPQRILVLSGSSSAW